MKILIYVTTVIFYFTLSSLKAQTVNYNIKLSHPGKAGSLNINVYNAAIEVNGHDGNDVKLTIVDNRRGADRNLGPAEFYFQILENNNNVSIINRESTPGQVNGLKLEIQIPKNFSAKLSTYFGPELKISGINGEVEANGYFTNLYLSGLNQNVVASTNEGNLVAYFDTINISDIHFISNYKGNIEVYFPKNTVATLLIDSYFGKYKSEFKLGLDIKNEKRYKSKFIRRTIGGGGKEIKLINYYGNIKINSL